jgi:3',5'-cyclic AMP phosphodiesterase CpdA
MPGLLHLSDPHFGTEQPDVVEALLALADQVQPEIAVLSGDITQRAWRRQFEAARRFMDKLPAQHRLVIPGNHDLPLFNLWGRFTAPYRGFQRAFGDDLAPVVDRPGYLVIGVNTTRAHRHTQGEVSAAQIDAVARRLRQAGAQQLRLVVTHQPMAVIRQSDRQNLLRNHRAAALAWAAAGADLVLGGHIHLPYLCDLRDEPGLAAPPGWGAGLRRAVWAVQAGTALSTRLRDGLPNSVYLIQQAPRERGCVCRVEQYDYHAGQRRFRPVAGQLLAFPHVDEPADGDQADTVPA